MSGKVVHFEVPVDDVARASAFYTEAFGWKLASMPGMGYTLATTTATNEQGMPAEPGAINGGMFVRERDIATPIITIDVADMDAALARVEELGGAIVRGKEAVGDMGFAAYFTDSEGNLMGLWQTARF